MLGLVLERLEAFCGQSDFYFFHIPAEILPKQSSILQAAPGAAGPRREPSMRQTEIQIGAAGFQISADAVSRHQEVFVFCRIEVRIGME